MRFSTAKQTSHESGIDHIRRCEALCRGVDAYSVHLNDPLEQAKEALKPKVLLEADQTEQNTCEFLNATEIPVSMHTRYIFSWSVALSAHAAGADQNLVVSAANGAVMYLQALLTEALKRERFGFVILTGQMQLESLGNAIGDYSVIISALALATMANDLNPEPDASGAKEIHAAMLRSKASRLMPAAREQTQGNSSATKELETYARVLGLN